MFSLINVLITKVIKLLLFICAILFSKRGMQITIKKRITLVKSDERSSRSHLKKLLKGRSVEVN